MARRLPEFRVSRKNFAVMDRLEWDPGDGGDRLDLTRMHVMKVESSSSADGSLPTVQVTFMGRLVDSNLVDELIEVTKGRRDAASAVS